MLCVGITGGIGSGKTVVTTMFRHLGVPVFDADTEAKRLMTLPPLKQDLIKMFGPKAFEGNILNRKWIAQQVFGDQTLLQNLNQQVHPAVIAAAAQWKQTHALEPFIVKEAALFFESGSAADMDFIVGVYSPKPLRVLRVMQRQGMSREEVLKRMEKQLDEEIKMRLCDFVVLNNDQVALLPQVLKLYHQFSKGELPPKNVTEMAGWL